MKKRRRIVAGIALLVWLFALGMQLTPVTAKGRSPLDPFVNTVLPNGLTLYVKEIHTTPIVAVDFWINTGVVNDPSDQLGISHFLEHMMFKGTPARSAFAIAKAIEDSGGYMNAATSMNTTHYYMTLPSDSLDLALEVETDALLHSSFDDADADKERQVILEEIRLHDDNPYRELVSLANRTLFAGTPYGNEIIGTPETLARIRHDQLVAYRDKYYAPNNMILAVVGDVSAKQVIAKVRELFQDVPSREIPPKAKLTPPQIRSIQRVVAEKPVDQTYLYMNFLIPKVSAEDYNSWVIVAKILGEGKASRLYQAIRERQQLANDVSAYFSSFAGLGILSVFAQAQGADVLELENAIRAEINWIVAKGVSGVELERAKAMIRCNNIYAAESATDIAAIFGDSALNNDLDGFIYAAHDFEKLTRGDIRRVIKKYLHADIFVSAVVKPQEVK